MHVVLGHPITLVPRMEHQFPRNRCTEVNQGHIRGFGVFSVKQKAKFRDVLHAVSRKGAQLHMLRKEKPTRLTDSVMRSSGQRDISLLHNVKLGIVLGIVRMWSCYRFAEPVCMSQSQT